jgi:excinuclease ABC subunit B
MRAAAADLDFEEAARLRDEIKRLRSTELAVIDDPTAKFLPPSPRGRGEGIGGRRPPSLEQERDAQHRYDEGVSRRGSDLRPSPLTRRATRGDLSPQAGRGEKSKIHKPALDEMGIALYHEVAPHRPKGRQDAGSAPGSAAGAGSGATGTKRSAPRKPGLDEMGPGVESIPGQKPGGPRSTLGRPGMRGGWKPRRR